MSDNKIIDNQIDETSGQQAENSKDDEMKLVLKMLEDGKINAKEAQEMLSALGFDKIKSKAEREESDSVKFRKRKAQKGKIHIEVIENGKQKVKMDIPSKLVNFIDNFVPGDILSNVRGSNIKGTKVNLSELMGSNDALSICVNDKNVRILNGDGEELLNINEE